MAEKQVHRQDVPSQRMKSTSTVIDWLTKNTHTHTLTETEASNRLGAFFWRWLVKEDKGLLKLEKEQIIFCLLQFSEQEVMAVPLWHKNKMSEEEKPVSILSNLHLGSLACYS